MCETLLQLSNASPARADSMSDLYRSAIGARLAKLPDLPALHKDSDEDESDEVGDSLTDLPGPGSGMGPPAM